MVNTGTNCLTKLEDSWETLLAALTSVQTFLGAADATAAAERVHISQPAEPADGELYARQEWEMQFPLILVWPDVDNGFRMQRVADLCYAESGTLYVEIARLPTAEELLDRRELLRNFKNSAGDIMEQIAAEITVQRDLRQIEFVGPMLPIEDDTESAGSPHISAMLTVIWGPGE